MPFNSNTYRSNKYRREAWDDLARAREIKARVAVGKAYPWEAERIAVFVKMARSSMRCHVLTKGMGDDKG